MRIVRNSVIPVKGFAAINLFGVIFLRKGATLTDVMLRHEAIHTAQMKEMYYVFFYIWYGLEWLIRLFGKENAYRSISFEKEAYGFEAREGYLYERRALAWVEYL